MPTINSITPNTTISHDFWNCCRKMFQRSFNETYNVRRSIVFSVVSVYSIWKSNFNHQTGYSFVLSHQSGSTDINRIVSERSYDYFSHKNDPHTMGINVKKFLIDWKLWNKTKMKYLFTTIECIIVIVAVVVTVVAAALRRNVNVRRWVRFILQNNIRCLWIFLISSKLRKERI